MLPGGSDHVSVDRTETLPKTQKRMAQRRLEPIIAKHEKRTRKTNLNSFKEKYLNLKKKLSALQIEVGASEDFLLIVKNKFHLPKSELVNFQSSSANDNEFSLYLLELWS